MMRHPEQVANIGGVKELLGLFDQAHDPGIVRDVQSDLFQASYRAQQAAGDIRRARKRLQDGKAPGWPVDHGAELAEFMAPAWRLRCDPGSHADKDWSGELRVAERVVRQLRSVGDALAWRVFRYDRRAIVALSSNSPPGPFVGKKGLGYELASVIDHWRERKTFTLLHDLTSVLRVMDSTELQPDGSLMVREVKSSPRASTSRQVRIAEAALAAIDGRARCRRPTRT
jgi:hypothetical protein